MDAVIVRTPTELLEEARRFPIDHVIHRYAKDGGFPVEIAREHADEVIKYLVFCSLNPDGDYGMSPVIDGFWHTFIWFTRDYHRFCHMLAGRYLHHTPSSEEDKRSGQARRQYLRVFEVYEDHFGKPPAHLWPRPPRTAATEMNNDCYTPACGCEPGYCNTCEGG